MKSLFRDHRSQRKTLRTVFVLISLLLFVSTTGSPAAVHAQDESPTPSPDTATPGDETPTETPQPTDTTTPTASPAVSATPDPTEHAVSAEPTATAEQTETPEPTGTAAPTATAMPTDTPTPTATLTPTITPTLTPTSTPDEPSVETVRVIVRLNLPAQPESQLMSAQAVRDQRMQIASTQDDLLEQFSALGAVPTARLETIPYIGLEVSPEALEKLQASPLVVSVTPDERMRLSLEESTSIIGADDVWAEGYTGAGQTIAILDTGVEASHPFFEGRVVEEACFSSNLCPDPDETYRQTGPGAASPELCEGIEGCWHGTHVAGIAAGDSATRRGVAPDANIIAIQIFSLTDDAGYCGAEGTPCLTSYTIDQISALEYVYSTLSTSYDIAAVNLSLGTSTTYDSANACDNDWSSTGYKEMVENLQTFGIATIAASGNDYDKDGLSAPACLSSVVSVGATTDADSAANFSNNGYILDLFAPGVNITSSVPGGGYGTASGTSMATPHVAGAWALLASANPESTISEIFTTLRDTGIWIDDTNGARAPRIRVDEALPSVRVANLNFDMTMDNSSPVVYDRVTFTLTVRNDGPTAATGVRVIVRLSGLLSFISDDSGGSYNLDYGTNGTHGSWDVGSIPAMASETLHITMQVRYPGNSINMANFIADYMPDPDSDYATSATVVFTTVGGEFVVNTTDDVDDGICDTSHCSLREAINAANLDDNKDVINFNIPGAGPHTIQPTSPLPPISRPVNIDGTTEPDYVNSPVIELDGTNAGSDSYGLRLNRESTARGLVINRFDTGIRLAGSRNVVEGCFIGTNLAGTAALGNETGIKVTGSSNRIGGSTPVERNIISGNEYGISLDIAPNTTYIIGNYIGTDVTGTVDLGNNLDGIFCGENCVGEVIGGLAAGEGNLISGNGRWGIFFDEYDGHGSVFQNNLIGTDVTGSVALPNHTGGIALRGYDNLIGGSDESARNIISSNGIGIQIQGWRSTNNRVEGNIIGLDITGTSALPNIAEGVVLTGTAYDNLVGDETPNIISGNGSHGILISDSPNNVIIGNFIGTNASGAEFGNGADGVRIEGEAVDNQIGRRRAGEGNVIAFNAGNGVGISAPGTNKISGNSIYSNGQLGIDLNVDGLTENDADDSDTGPNGLQNMPILDSASVDGQVGVAFWSTPDSTFILEFFSSPTCDASGYGEGKTYLGSGFAMLGSDGYISGVVYLGGSIPAGHFVTATATDSDGNTSEFSNCKEAGVRPATVTDLIAPSGMTPSSQPTFRWGAASGATHYYLQVFDPARGYYEHSAWHEAATICADGECEIAPMNLLDGDYSWLVLSWNDYGYGEWSEATAFNVGPSFSDVPHDHWAFDFVEALVAAGVTSGCGNGNYCPDEPVSRAQMAVFLERAKRGEDFTPPAAVGMFNDVPTSHWAASWIEQLANDGITSGCGGGNYCPEQSVSRAQMAVFLEVGKRGTSFTPASAIGMFSDVPTSHWAADWVEQLANDGITSGCGGGNYCPENAVTRAQMAVFLTKAFELPTP